MSYEMRNNVLTNAEWEMLAKIDDDILNNRYDKHEDFLDSITQEEAAAIIKWVNRNVNNIYDFEDWEHTKEEVVKVYIIANAEQAISDVIDDKAIELWRFTQNCI